MRNGDASGIKTFHCFLIFSHCVAVFAIKASADSLPLLRHPCSVARTPFVDRAKKFQCLSLPSEGFEKTAGEGGTYLACERRAFVQDWSKTAALLHRNHAGILKI